MTLCVEADRLKQQCITPELGVKLSEVIPLDATVNGDDLVVYDLDELSGKIMRLETYRGLPSDENALNSGLADANEEFSKLLHLEDLCQ